MTDRIHPNTAATKPHQRNAAGTRPLYRPQLHGRGRQKRRSCCCSLFLFLTLIIISLVILISIISAGFYFLYRPHRPSFSVTALKLSHFKISSSPSSSKLDSKFDLNITATNPNKKLSFIYDPISISVLSDGIDVGDGSFSGFVHGKNSVTVIKVGVSSGREIESGDIEKLKSDMKSKISGMGLEIKLDTKVKMKIGRLKSPRIGIRVSCKGITVNVPTGKKEATALTSNAKCKVDVRIKIWKWIV